MHQRFGFILMYRSRDTTAPTLFCRTVSPLCRADYITANRIPTYESTQFRMELGIECGTPSWSFSPSTIATCLRASDLIPCFVATFSASQLPPSDICSRNILPRALTLFNLHTHTRARAHAHTYVYTRDAWRR